MKLCLVRKHQKRRSGNGSSRSIKYSIKGIIGFGTGFVVYHNKSHDFHDFLDKIQKIKKRIIF